MTGDRVSEADTTVLSAPSSDTVGIASIFNAHILTLPYQYSSGSELSGSMLIVGHDFNSLGIVTEYAQSFDLFGGQDRLDLSTGVVIPEPSSYALLLGVVACSIVYLRRKNKPF